MMLDTKEKAVTQVTLEFFSNLVQLFVQFLLLFQKSSTVIHLLYDKICSILVKLVRFMKTQSVDKMDLPRPLLNVRM